MKIIKTLSTNWIMMELNNKWKQAKKQHVKYTKI